jgi:predicted PurR-regulated permease PerM
MINESKYSDYFLELLLAIGLIVCFLIFRPFISLIMLAATFTILAWPMFLWIRAKVGGRQTLAALLGMIVVVLIIIIPLVAFALLVLNELLHLLTPQVLSSLNVNGSGIIGNLHVDFGTYIHDVATNAANSLGSIFSNVATFFLYCVLLIISVFFFFKDGEHVKDTLLDITPLTSEQKSKLSQDIVNGVRAVIGGSLLVAALQGIVSGISFTIFGVPNPALWAFVVAILALLPSGGSSLINIPAVVFLFIVGKTGDAIGLFAWFVLSISIIDNYLYPRFIAGRVNIHPLVTLIAVVGGLQLFGPLGFLAGPLCVVFFWSILEISKIGQRPVLKESPGIPAISQLQKS